MTKKELKTWVNKKLKEYNFFRPPYNKNGDWIWDLEIRQMWVNRKEFEDDDVKECNARKFYKSMYKNSEYKDFWDYLEKQEPQFFVKGAVWDFCLERAEIGEVEDYLTLELGIGLLEDEKYYKQLKEQGKK